MLNSKPAKHSGGDKKERDGSVEVRDGPSDQRGGGAYQRDLSEEVKSHGNTHATRTTSTTRNILQPIIDPIALSISGIQSHENTHVPTTATTTTNANGNVLTTSDNNSGIIIPTTETTPTTLNSFSAVSEDINACVNPPPTERTSLLSGTQKEEGGRGRPRRYTSTGSYSEHSDHRRRSVRISERSEARDSESFLSGPTEPSLSVIYNSAGTVGSGSVRTREFHASQCPSLSSCINPCGIKMPDPSSLSSWLGDMSVPVYILVMMFAMASWIDINGLWVEVPLLVNTLPEGWNLPSYIVIIIQVANIGPIAYTIANRLAPNRVKEWPVVYIIITIGAVSCFLLGFFWDVTSIIGGKEHSTAFFALSTTLALVDCTSSVVFLPYMSIFKPQYMTAYYIGEGLSGLVPGLVGLMQGVGGDPICVNKSSIIHNATTGENTTIWEIVAEYADPNFSVDAFFFFLGVLIVISGVCFTVLNFAPFCQAETISVTYSYDIKQEDFDPVSDPRGQDDTPGQQQDPPGDESGRYSKVDIMPSDPSSPTDPSTSARPETSNLHLTNSVAMSSSRDEDGRDRSKPGLSKSQLWTLLIVTAWVNSLTNGILPSTQSFSALPYSNLAYTLSVRLGTVANPLACFVALLLPSTSVVTVLVLTGIGTVLSAYQLVLAAMSPFPPLHDSPAGEALCIVTFVILTGVFSYSKVTIASMLQAEGGRKALLWCGALTQVGSFCGAVITFILVNVLQVFESVYPCT